MSTAVAEQLLTQLRSLVPLGTQTPSDADIKGAQDVLRKLKVAEERGSKGKGARQRLCDAEQAAMGDGDSGTAPPSPHFSESARPPNLSFARRNTHRIVSSSSFLSIASLLSPHSWSW